MDDLADASIARNDDIGALRRYIERAFYFAIFKIFQRAKAQIIPKRSKSHRQSHHAYKEGRNFLGNKIQTKRNSKKDEGKFSTLREQACDANSARRAT